MEMTKLVPLGPPGRINLPYKWWTAACHKTFFSWTPLTGKEAQGEDTAGILSHQLLPTLLLTFTQQILLGRYCVRERESERLYFMDEADQLGPCFCCRWWGYGSSFMLTAPWHLLKGVFKAQSPILMTGFWAVKLTEFNLGKVNLIEKESRIKNSSSIPRRPLMGKGPGYEVLGKGLHCSHP